MQALAGKVLGRLHFTLEQVRTCPHADDALVGDVLQGENPYTGEKVYVARSQEEKRRQKGISSGRRSPAHDRRRGGGRQPRKGVGRDSDTGKRDVRHSAPPCGKSRKEIKIPIRSSSPEIDSGHRRTAAAESARAPANPDGDDRPAATRATERSVATGSDRQVPFDGFAQVLVVEVRVDFGRDDVFVPQHLLHLPNRKRRLRADAWRTSGGRCGG